MAAVALPPQHSRVNDATGERTILIIITISAADAISLFSLGQKNLRRRCSIIISDEQRPSLPTSGGVFRRSRGRPDGVEKQCGDGADHEAGDEQELLDGDPERRARLVLLAAVGEAAVVDLVALQVVVLPEAQLLHVAL